MFANIYLFIVKLQQHPLLFLISSNKNSIKNGNICLFMLLTDINNHAKKINFIIIFKTKK